MKRNLFKKYSGFFKGSFYNFLAFKGEIIVWTLQSFLTCLVLVFVWFSIYVTKAGDGGSISDVTINNMNLVTMIYYLILVSVSSTWTVNASTSFESVSEDVYDGNIAINLTKPISYRLRNLISSFGCALGRFLVLFVPSFILTTFIFGLAFNFWPTWYNLLFYLFIGILSIILIDSFDFMFGQISFVTHASFGLLIIKGTIFSFLAGAMIPFDFMGTFGKVLQYLPFSITASAPINILLGRYTFFRTINELILAGLWTIVFLLLSFMVNNIMIKKVESVGG